MNLHFLNRVTALSCSLLLCAVATGCSKSTPSTTAAAPSPMPASTVAPLATTSPTITPMPANSPFADVQLRMRDLQSQLDNVFAQTFRDFGTDFGQSGFASSVDLRDQNDRYVARVYLPNGDTSKVNATINGNNLEITMNGAEAQNGAAASEKYQEVLTLPQPVRADQLKIERKPNMVVISVPKSTASTVAQTAQQSPVPAAATSPSLGATINAWDQRMVDDMRRMETRMDQMFHQTFPNDVANGGTSLELGSTVNVDNEKDKYIVHFALPNRDISNVKVNLENGELHLTAQEQKNSSTSSQQSIERGSYEEMVTLPGPVKESEMKVNRQANAVVVTLPKA